MTIVWTLDILSAAISFTDFPRAINLRMSVSVAVRTVLFVCVVSRLLYGQLPVLSTLVLFIFLLGVFAVGAPGVPGGTVLASLGIVASVLGFDDAGTAMLIVILLCRIASAQLATSPVTVLWL